MSSTTRGCENSALNKAVMQGEVNNVRELLKNGADPKNLKRQSYLYGEGKDTATDHCYIEIVKLLVQYGIDVDILFLENIFCLPCINHVKELITHVLNHHANDRMMHMVFDALIGTSLFVEEPSYLEILTLLVDRGLPINDSYNYVHCGFEYGLTALHMAIYNSKIDFVS